MNISEIKNLFPALKQKIYDKPLVYLDSAATTLKPISVIEKVRNYYSLENSNVHRGAHYLSQKATDQFEAARENVAQFLNAKSTEEIIFVRGTTEAINLVATSFGESLNEGDEIIISILEHHANIVPWHMLKTKKKVTLRFIHLDDQGNLNLEEYKKLLNPRVKLVSLTACSNTLGLFPDLETYVTLARLNGSKTLVDGAQLVSQKKVNVQKLNCDFFVFSGHKLFAPTGIGVLFGKKEILNEMPPYQGGGAMISDVSEERTLFNQLPFKFEAGTPHIEGVLGLSEAIHFLKNIPFQEIETHEDLLLKLFMSEVKKIPEVIVYGDSLNKGAIVSFNIKGAHHSDVAQILDQQAIAVRAGHHCTQPLMKYLNLQGTVRASFSIYNDEEDVMKLIAGIKKSKELLL
ncbi:MAG: cysteine desulfurase [Deltaproteobacteria bacterium]|jgi:cysteine desulfurase/selenocysteine lyase|nr:cysteine desulfurase [Deltaproteobacteria bacterium]